MLKQVKIENFKSVKKVDVKVGRFNVIIGENGAGKSNFLEALAVYSAIETGKFDHEFLWPRGIRFTEPKELLSLFDHDTKHFSIEISDTSSNQDHKASVDFSEDMVDLSDNKIELVSTSNNIKSNSKIKIDHESSIKIGLTDSMKKLLEDLNKSNQNIKNNDTNNSNDTALTIFKSLIDEMSESNKKELVENIAISLDIQKRPKYLDRFLVYSPENTALKNLVKDGQILPLGVNGEGLFKQIQRIKAERDLEARNNTVYKDSFSDIIDSASKFDWVESIDISDSTNPLDHKIRITDQYLVQELDQRSANEGFLFVLFYVTLFCSKNTPKIFAIDNIDASLNPKMCRVLIELLIKFAKKYDKQVFVTTHNPAILDGLNLYDEEQALFVVSRNSDGHTKLKRMNRDNLPKEILDSSEALRLSEAFIRGYLGGLPKNF
ncbi:ATP-binding protein [Acinetobacter seifertii]|uniref:AAA family ATPase n=1 Tax=Acinetobacter seifertii TaxID=1530123 RepID=A0A7H2SM66_9GAMM|nr:AAA family ATPase [Acinetobacter seifertii]QNX12775.1 ATP-binding protein [Acinetobacter seifertii]QNX19291.1 ATP-binding protein [Acinetobacter seifertii]QNX25898.1 ATP-binding protein [Acinetobacter seifertii]QNX36926.1 ATP-binding protein [Acinetobacter seifertii]QNX40699.1 ATP-binding protein [Acinetobacter seifertii]